MRRVIHKNQGQIILTTTFPSSLPPVVALDTETTGLHFKLHRVFGFSIAWQGFSAYYDIRKQPEALSWLRDSISRNPGTLWVFFNATFDLKMLANEGVHFDLTKVDDVAIRACLIDEHLMSYSLDSLMQRYLGKEKYGDIYQELADMFGGMATRNVQMPNLQHAPAGMVEPYAEIDAEGTFELWHWQEGEIKAQDIREICEFERRTIPHVYEQEIKGVRVDLDVAERAMNELHIKIDQEKSKLNSLIGRPFNPNSAPQIREYFNPQGNEEDGYIICGGYPTKQTPKGNPSIDNDVLQSIVNVDPVAQSIIDIRSLIRTADTFLAKHVIGHSIDGRVYPTINQVAGDDGGTKTGRFSYVDPALGQIPNRNKTVAAIVKPCFLPDEGQKWLDGDLNSFEVRCFAHLVGAFNDALVQAYAEDPFTDFHGWVAELMGVPRNPHAKGGANAKQLNLSMIFNSGNGAIANLLGLPCTPAHFTDESGKRVNYFKAGKEAMAVINSYHRKVRGVKELAQKAEKAAKRRGYVFTMYGRRLRFASLWKHKTYKASGVLIQATAADINKENWSLVSEALGDRGRLLINTHDSYSMSVDEDKVEECWKDVKGQIERPILRVPLILDRNGCGENWWAALQG